MIVSTDAGKTWARRGGCNVPNDVRQFDEHMFVERKDGNLWMLIRNTGGIAQSTSTDGGRTWRAGSMFLSGGTTASKRFYVRRLRSGALLLVRNNSPTGSGRSHLTSFVSDDDGLTWQGGLLLDERESSYPDGTEGPDGTLYVIYDQTRYTLNREGKPGTGSVLLAKFTEADVRASRPVDSKTKLKAIVTRLRDE